MSENPSIRYRLLAINKAQPHPEQPIYHGDKICHSNYSEFVRIIF